MSVDNFYFVRDEKLPTLAEWQAALDRASADIVLDDVGDLRTHAGYIPAIHRGLPSGFEWYYGPLATNFGGDVPDGLDGREHVINIVTHGNMGELLCGLVACSVLAQRAEGLMYDEESCGLISADEALQSAREIESLEHERKQRAVEKQASITSRRCPKCASPCPEYRKTCRACGFELGREV